MVQKINSLTAATSLHKTIELFRLYVDNVKFHITRDLRYMEG